VMMDKLYRQAGISAIVVFAWLAFVLMTTRTQEQYLVRNMTEVGPGEVVPWQNEQARLMLKGWSRNGEMSRSSMRRHVGICLKPKRETTGSSERSAISIGLDLTTPRAIAGKDLRIALSPHGGEGTVTLAAERSTYAISGNFDKIPEMLCVNMELPPDDQGLDPAVVLNSVVVNIKPAV
jgi:hypothetical protein